MQTILSPVVAGQPPFDHALLDALMADAGLDVLVASSRHNTRYLLGGYSFFFFASFDPIGVSRYLPLVVYVRGRAAETVYVGNGMEAFEHENGRFWMADVHTKSWGSLDATAAACDAVRRLCPDARRIGIEPSFLPHDAAVALGREFPGAEVRDGQRVLELLRVIKRPEELHLLKEASERVISSMMAVIGAHGPGCTKHDLVAALRTEEARHGLDYEYCLISAGRSHNRAPSDYVLQPGDILSMDSGGSYGGYIGDLCRMGVMGEPDAELEDLLAEVDAVQMAARRAIVAGRPGQDVYDAAEEAVARAPHRDRMDFLAHGMGLVAHEAPRLTAKGQVPYDAADAALPLRPGMVLSIETAIKHPTRGFLKLEDTVALTADGPEAYGDAGRGWIRGGASAPAGTRADA